MRGDKRENIIRVLLNHKEALSKNELSKRANCTRQWVILFLKELGKKKHIRKTSPTHRKKLLEYWMSISKKPKKKKVKSIPNWIINFGSNMIGGLFSGLIVAVALSLSKNSPNFILNSIYIILLTITLFGIGVACMYFMNRNQK